jgi:dihydropteroate synthase
MAGAGASGGGIDGPARAPRGPAEPVARAVAVWGVLNITPDSFSDGGRFLAEHDAVAHAKRMLAEGADVIDVGGASSRPRGATYGDGASEVTPAVEAARVVPVVRLLARELGATISIDTTSAEVAAAALEAGATIVNDVSMGASDALVREVGRRGAALVLMHTRGKGEVAGANVAYTDVVADVLAELGQAVARAEALGVARDRLWIDPGLGFAKTEAQSTTLLAHTRALGALGLPVLVGASRKGFLGALTARRGEKPAPDQRVGASVAAACIAAQGGAAAVRVHDVRETVQALAVLAAVHRAGEEGRRA